MVVYFHGLKRVKWKRRCGCSYSFSHVPLKIAIRYSTRISGVTNGE